jgi:branched-chain amino acid transport system ATP-binding protein
VTVSGPPGLQVSHVSAGYGAIRVLWDVSLEVPAGAAVVLLGANGAGKSTLLRAIMGLIPLEAGELRLFGEPITRATPDKRVAAAMTYASEVAVFAPLSVEDNLRVGAYGLPRREVRAALARSWAEFPLLAERRRAQAGQLSGGQRKLLGLAKALIRRPRLLVMDEPSSGLSPLMVSTMVGALTAVREKHQVTLLLAEQNAKFLDLADRVCILSGGRTRFAGTVQEFRAQTDIAAHFFGLPEAGEAQPDPEPPQTGRGHAADGTPTDRDIQ